MSHGTRTYQKKSTLNTHVIHKSHSNISLVCIIFITYVTCLINEIIMLILCLIRIRSFL